jgi:DNA-binding MarR family transcriptional regulator
MMNPKRMHPPVTGVLDALRRIVRDLRQSSRTTEREFGIGGAQLFVLQQLADSPLDSINELADRTYTHQSSVSVVVRRLVEQGLVVRRPAAADRRRRELKLTAAGRRVVARAPVAAQVRLINALLRLPEPQLGRLERLLRRVVKTMGAAGEPAEMLFAPDAAGDPARRRRRVSPRRSGST